MERMGQMIRMDYLLRERKARPAIWAILVLACLVGPTARGDEDPDRGAAYRARPRTAAQGQAPAPRTSVRTTSLRPPDRISLTFSNVDVRDALVRIAQYSAVDVILAPGATGTISINLRERTPEEAVRMVASSAGLYVTKAKGAFVVGSAAEVQRAVSEFGLTEVVHLQHAVPADAASFLAKAAPTVRTEAMATGVSMTGLLDDLRKAREALREYDVPVPQAPDKQDTLLIALEKADPERAEAVLRQAFPGMTFGRQDRVIVVTGPSRMLETVDKAGKAIDVAAPTPPEETQVAFYRVKYLNAERAEEALKALFPDMKIAAAPEPNMPPTAMFYPLTTGAFGSGDTTGGGSGAGGGMGGGMGGAGGATGTGGAQGAGGSAGISGPPFSRSSGVMLAGKSSDVKSAVEALQEMDVAPPSVRIDAALVELSDDAVKELGVDWSWQDGHFTFAQSKSGAAAFSSSTINASDFTAAVKALVNQKKANLLANPNISCVDNEDASIFIGELRRFRGSTVVTPGIGTVQGTETVPVGVALLVRPRIHPDRNITLKVHPVVSSVLSTVDGLPQTASREADTTVQLREGEELIIGGLYRTEDIRSTDKIPLLGDLPLIGGLFRSTSNTKSKSEIVVVLRAYPVFPNPAPVRNFQKGVTP